MSEAGEQEKSALERLLERKKFRSDIVVIEDKEEDRDSLVKVLEDSGYSVLAVKDSRKTLHVLDSQKVQWIPEAVVLDLVLSGSSGYDLLRTLITRFQLKKVPLIVVSSMSAQEDIFEAQTAGASAYVVKPFEPEDLQEALLSALENIKKPSTEQRPGIFVRRGSASRR